MTRICVYPEPINGTPRQYRAVADEGEAVGATVGQAIDALRERLGGGRSTVVVVDPFAPDAFFTGEQLHRLSELMARWRAARDAGQRLPPAEQAELDALIEAEWQAAIRRSADMLRRRGP